MTVYALPSVTQTDLPQGMPTVCALGLFDGVHAGHRALLAQTVRAARERGAIPIVYTFFDQDYKGGAQITTLPERIALLAAEGIAYAVIESFAAVRNLSAADFVNTVLRDRLHVCHAVCGENYRFGTGAVGTADTLSALLAAHDATCHVVPPVCFGTDGALALPPEALSPYCTDGAARIPISSTVIRAMLQAGKPEWAQCLLGRPYEITAPVVTGRQLGRILGFPTANQAYPADKVRLPNGVYLCRARRADGQSLCGVCNIGCNPTVSGSAEAHLETHLLTTEPQDLYGQPLTVSFLRRLRAEQTFASVDALKDAIAQNVAQAKEYFGI